MPLLKAQCIFLTYILNFNEYNLFHNIPIHTLCS
nr:MAG TPA: hypothetical protein [Caudoviricetes sp.]